MSPAPVFLAPGPEAITTPLGVEQGAVYTFIGPDGTRAVINNPYDRDFVGYLSEPPSGLERAGVRESADLIPEGDGGIHGTFRYDRLPFTLTGVLPPSLDAGAVTTASWLGRQAKLLRATDAMAADGRLLWTPSEAPPVFVTFRQQQPTRITGRRPKTFFVGAVSEDPLIYSQALNVGQALVTGSGATALSVTNAGTKTTWPVITLTGPITNPVIANTTTGQSITLAYDLTAGHTLTIDTNPRRRRIILDAATNAYSAYTFAVSSWWGLAPGVNALTITPSASASPAQIAVQWRDAWG